MPNPLVPIDKGVILDQREGRCRRLGWQVGVEVLATKLILGCAAADSSAPRSRIPGERPHVPINRSWSVTISPRVRCRT